MISHSKPWITEGDRRSVDSVLATGMLAQGEAVASFEDAVARLHGAAGAVATANGTAALELVLLSLGISSGDEVVIPSYVCINVLQAIRAVGASPVFADIGPHWTMGAAEIAKVASTRTRAIVAVHTFGIAEDVASMLAFGVPVIEDCCQAFGARRGGRLAGAVGSAGVFSFHGTKCLTTGEGGMALSSNPALVESMKKRRDGADPAGAYRFAAPMSELQAALGLSQLARYPDFLERRSRIAERYFARLPTRLTCRLRSIGVNSMLFRFPLYSPEIRAALDINALASHAIATRHGVDSLLHRVAGLPDGAFPLTVASFEHTLSIPIYPSLSESDQDRVVDVICAHYAN